MGQSYASPLSADGERFVTVHLPAAPATGPSPSPAPSHHQACARATHPEVVLARLDLPLRPSALVVACGCGGAAELRRVGRVSDEGVELLAEAADAAAPLRVARAEAPLLGTVLLRWAALDG